MRITSSDGGRSSLVKRRARRVRDRKPAFRIQNGVAAGSKIGVLPAMRLAEAPNMLADPPCHSLPTTAGASWHGCSKLG
jgi:hypothetical protein